MTGINEVKEAMNVWEFMSDSPWTTFFLALMILAFFKAILKFCIVMKNGYPPIHCDADGDFRKEDE